MGRLGWPRLIAVIALTAAALILLSRAKGEMADFEVPYRAAVRVLDGEALYRAADGHFQFKYFPAFALAMVPFAVLPLGVAKVAWLFVVLGSLAALVVVSQWERPRGGFEGWLMITTVVLVEAKFYAHEATLGQFNALMGALVLAGLAVSRRGHATAAGLLVAAAVLVKPYPVIFLPYFMLTRQWRAAGGLVLGSVLILASPATVYGTGGNLAQLTAWAHTTAESTAPLLVNQDNVSVWAMWAKWLGPGSAAAALGAATVGALGLLVCAVLWQGGTALLTSPERSRHAAFLETGLLLSVIPLCSPQGWDYGLLLTTPAVMLLVNRFSALTIGWRVAVAVALAAMGGSVYDLLGRRLYASFMASSAITICALVIVLALWRLRRAGAA